MQCLFPPWLIPTGGLWLHTGSLTWEVHAGSDCSLSVYGQETLSVQDVLGKELKSEAEDFGASESGSVHVRCTAVTTAKGPG